MKFDRIERKHPARAPGALAKETLVLLADGRFHSGESLANAFGVSRTAVWKTIAGLRRSGYCIESVRGRGYRWEEAIEPLDAARITAACKAYGLMTPPLVEVRSTVVSTNTVLRESGGNNTPRVLFAEQQTGGRGRLGREWSSPLGGIYCSLAWPFAQLPQGPNGLSLAIGVQVAEALSELGLTGHSVKWPNDLIHNDTKLGGILIELVGEPTGPCQIIVGLGLNWRLPASVSKAFAQPAIGVADLMGRSQCLSRNELAAHLVVVLCAACADFPTELPRLLAERWPRFDVLAGREVRLELPQRTVTGVARGVDAQGALMLETDRGLERFLSGDTRLRPTP